MPATNKGHAKTSSVLLMYEADLVSNVMGNLYQNGTHCLYAFNALWVGKSFAEQVRKIMDECALDAGIPCKAKIGDDINYGHAYRRHPHRTHPRTLRTDG